VPVVALTGWFVQLTGRSNVSVFNRKQLVDLFKSRALQPLSDTDVQHVAQQIEQRCRTVAPRCANEERAS
jgi:hypothetical protein